MDFVSVCFQTDPPDSGLVFFANPKLCRSRSNLLDIGERTSLSRVVVLLDSFWQYLFVSLAKLENETVSAFLLGLILH